MRHKAERRSARVSRAFVVALALCVPLVAASSALATTSYTWAGGAAVGTSGWDSGANWGGGTAPSGSTSVGTLDFPQLTSSVCTSSPQTGTCYTSSNDLSGLAVNELEIGSSGYDITALDDSTDGITLGSGGSGGIDATFPPSVAAASEAFFGVPTELVAQQTWSISGGELLIGEPLTSSSPPAALGIDLSDAGHLVLEGTTNEVGPVTINGSGASATQNGAVEVGTGASSSTLNYSDQEAVKVNDAVLEAGDDAEVGPLTANDADIDVNDSVDSQLTVNGAVALGGSTGTQLELPIVSGSGKPKFGTDYGQLSATGMVTLSNATLSIDGTSSGTCPSPTAPVGTMYTLVDAAGGLTGTFTNAAPGALLSCGDESYAITYNDGAGTVTATVAPATPDPTTTSVACSPSSVATGVATTCTATVTDTASSGATTPSGTVSFTSQPTTGVFTGSCSSLSPVMTGTASCQITFTPSAAGSYVITGTYSGDSTHATSNGMVAVSTAAAPPPVGLLAGAKFGAPVSGTVSLGMPLPLCSSACASGPDATLTVPAGALSAGTTVSLYPVTNAAALTAALQAAWQAETHMTGIGPVVLGFAVSCSPHQTASSAITLTIHDPRIVSYTTMVYVFTSGGLVEAEATLDGQITITFTSDPIFLVANLPPITGARVSLKDHGSVTIYGLDTKAKPGTEVRVELIKSRKIVRRATVRVASTHRFSWSSGALTTGIYTAKFLVAHKLVKTTTIKVAAAKKHKK